MSSSGLEGYRAAMQAQGENLRRSRTALLDQLADLDLGRWRPPARLGLLGIGASYNAALGALAPLWEGDRQAGAWLGPDLLLPGAARNIDSAIAISQTGRSAEVVAAVEAIADRCATLALTDEADSRLARASAATLVLDLLPDSEVRTLGYTATLQALGMLAGSLAGAGHADDAWDALAGDVERRLPEAARTVDRIVEPVRMRAAIEVVGAVAAFGTAAQGALLLREVARIPAAAYETRNYLHGPIEVLDATTALIAVGGPREARLARAMARAGALVTLITSEDADDEPGLTVVRVPPLPYPARAVLEIIPFQALAGALAAASGVPVGEFRNHQDDTKLE